MYIQQQEGVVIIPADLKQTFENKFTLNIGKNEIIKMKNNNAITERDLKIAKFLFQFTFATAEQLHTFLEEESTVGNIKGRLDKLVKYRILNKFMLGSYEDDRIHSDAFEVYCMDLGGKYLLSHYSNEDTTDWYSTVNMKTSEIVGKNLIATEFYIRLKQSVGERLVHFKSLPEMRVGKKNVIPSFEFCLKEGIHRRYFVGEVAREFDFPVYFYGSHLWGGNPGPRDRSDQLFRYGLRWGRFPTADSEYRSGWHHLSPTVRPPVYRGLGNQ